MSKLQRDIAIDIAKGIGIILVVVGHINAEVTRIFNECIYQFHVPFFFFISGMLLNMGNGFYRFLMKKVKRLYIPAVFWLTIFYIVILLADYWLRGNTFDYINFFKHNILQILGLRVNLLGGAIWFLFTLFRTSLLFALILYICKQFFFKIPEKYVVFFMMLFAFMIGFYVHFPYHLEVDCLSLGYICLGRLYYISGMHRLNCNLSRYKQRLLVIFGYISVFLMHYFNSVNIAIGNFGIPLFTICTSVIGSMVTIDLSILLIKWKKAANFLSYIGQRSIWIVIGHFVAFKIITVVQIFYYHSDPVNFFSHPAFVTEGCWIPIYLIAGILLPLAFCNVYRLLIKKSLTNNLSLY